MYLVNFKTVASGVDSLVAQDYVDISTCTLIRSGTATVILYLQGLDGGGGVANDKITITVEGTTAEKQAHVDKIAKELAFMVNRAKVGGVGNLTRMDVVGSAFLNLKSASMTANNAILTITATTAL